MNIDQRDIEKGSLTEILPRFYPNSISYLSELNEYRMYAEVWNNNRNKERKQRKIAGQDGYLKTLEVGEERKRRKVDHVRFGYFVVANSVNYKIQKNLYGRTTVCLQMGGIQTNSIFNDIIKANRRLYEIQSLYPDSGFHSAKYLPKTFEIKLEDLDLQQDKQTNKYYFEISTNSTEISNSYQRMLLLLILGEDAFAEKLQLLHKTNRKLIKCFLENPENNEKNANTSNAISRLCVAWPFHETIVFDFAGKPEDYKEACLFGTFIKAKAQAEDTGWANKLQIDSYV